MSWQLEASVAAMVLVAFLGFLAWAYNRSLSDAVDGLRQDLREWLAENHVSWAVAALVLALAIPNLPTI